MSEEFKEHLRKYSEGSLPEDERTEVERELEKLEAYQVYLEELMEQEDQQTSQRFIIKPDLPEKNTSKKAKKTASRKEKKIIRRGKWKARFANTFTVLAVFLAFTVISTILTGVFYNSGDRVDRYRDVLISAVAVSRPNTSLNLNANGKFFFRMEFSGRLQKQIGSEQVDVGSYSSKFLLGLGGIGNYNWTDQQSGNTGSFIFDYPQAAQSTGGQRSDAQEWERLVMLPEGTVAEAYLSFDQLYSTDELLRKLEPLNVLPVWFAVDGGLAADERSFSTLLGFPYQPLWHAEDMTVREISSEKWGWFGKVTSSSSSSPSVESYGSGELREQNFIETLQLLQKYKTITRNAAPFLKVDESLSYLEEHGIHLYGAVITGPVKELLKLQQNSWVSNIRIGEVRLWNWRD
ncbi:anti-sigma factor [Paenibacillus pedocola]|uniref:anti-sigma factor n=1 Tax=Paenibacillus pedocola TaxID=3242193 RepID=UPI002877E13A|nr:anti-sigma factor [Paenibacillus typhae]